MDIRATLTHMTGAMTKYLSLNPLIMKQGSLDAVGIDVAKAELSVCLLFRNGSTRALSIRNIKTDIINKLIIKLNGFKGKIIMESTNYYHWAVALSLTQKGFDVRIVNPIQSKKYASSSIRPIKSDKADAESLARMALIENKLPKKFHGCPKKLALRKKIGTISSLSAQIQSLVASYKSLTEAKEICGEEISDAERKLEENILALKRIKKKLETEVVAETKKLEDSKKVERFQSIPGVSEFMACLAVHWFENNKDEDRKSWIAYAGLDISVKESGSWKGRTRLTKRGNNFLRKRLFAAAWGAVMNDEEFKKYYDYLRQNCGRSYVEAIIIIARKIVRTLYILSEDNSIYSHKKAIFVPKMPIFKNMQGNNLASMQLAI
jgi:transposase